MPHIHEPVRIVDQMKERMAEDVERKAKADGIKMYTKWLDKMIEMETTHPTGPSNAHVYEGCKKYFLEMVAK